jgi:hypothetical protein
MVKDLYHWIRLGQAAQAAIDAALRDHEARVALHNRILDEEKAKAKSGEIGNPSRFPIPDSRFPIPD